MKDDIAVKLEKSKLALAVIILAAGEGKRMKSAMPKVLHAVCGQPMLKYAVDLATKLNPEKILIVIRPSRELFNIFKGQAEMVVQETPLGTADAVLRTEPFLRDFKGDVLVLSGDTPLLRAKTIERLAKAHFQGKAAVTLLTAAVKEPKGYGRIIRNNRGEVERIVEERDCSPGQRRISEINAGTYIFKTEELFTAVSEVTAENDQMEFYLTDCIEILRKRKKKIQAVKTDGLEILGVNSRKELALAGKILRERINSKWMERGITLVDPASTFIDAEVTIGNDTVIYPFSFLEGKTAIGANSKIGPFARLANTKVGRNVEIQNSVVKESIIANEAVVGPFSHLRPGTVIKKGAKVGAFVEIKKSEIGPESKVPHLSYIGDATIGREANIGAGTITCNYDGINKHKTVIGDYAFIGSDTQLVAPVKRLKKAVTGAGSTITKNVPDESLALERTKQTIIEGWFEKRMGKDKKAKDKKKNKRR